MIVNTAPGRLTQRGNEVFMSFPRYALRCPGDKIIRMEVRIGSLSVNITWGWRVIESNPWLNEKWSVNMTNKQFILHQNCSLVLLRLNLTNKQSVRKFTKNSTIHERFSRLFSPCPPLPSSSLVLSLLLNAGFLSNLKTAIFYLT